MTASGRRDIAYINARLIDPASGLDEPGELLTRGAHIAALGPRLFADGVPTDATVVDCGGHILCPGLIDMLVFTGEPGEEHRESLASAGQAAAAGGITTLITMPNTAPPIDNVALVEFVVRRGQNTAAVNIHPMAATTVGLEGKVMTELALMAEAGAVAFTDGRHAVADARVMSRILSYASSFGLLLVQHAEEPSLAAGGCMNQGETATRLGLPGIQAVAETIMIERDLTLVGLAGGRYHVAQVSCAPSLEVIRRAKAAGIRVTCGAAAHHFALNESAIGDYRTFAKTSPPLRAESDREAVAGAVADGTVDVIVSAHDPWDQESKRVPFAQAACGMVGLETLLPLALELHHGAAVPLARLLHALTAAPAGLLGLPGGRLAPGAPADLVVIDIEAPWRVDTAAFVGKSKNSPFDGRPVQGRAVCTVVAGETVFDAGPAS